MEIFEQYFPMLTLAVALIALLFVGLTAKKVFGFSEGNERMSKLSASIRSGANAFLKRQYTVVAIIFLVVAIILGIMAISGNLSPFVPFAFLTGGIYSALAGFIGMKIATASNARTANACQTSLNKGLKVAFSAGSVMGFTVVALGLFDISVWFILLKFAFKLDIDAITNAMVMFGMGASFMALFARVGGGIFTKAADVGADLVGKVEAGIPEDDPRNPAVIADNVGDNVGDVARNGCRPLRVLFRIHRILLCSCNRRFQKRRNRDDDQGGHRSSAHCSSGNYLLYNRNISCPHQRGHQPEDTSFGSSPRYQPCIGACGYRRFPHCLVCSR